MKYSALVALMGTTQATSKGALIAQGIFTGALNYSFPAIEDCFADETVIEDDAEQMVVDIEKMSIAGIVAAVKEIGQIALDLEVAVAGCSNVLADLTKFEVQMAPFMNPEDFVFHAFDDVWLNKVSIGKELAVAEVDYRLGRYEQFGEQVGFILSNVIVGKQTLPISPKQNAEIIQGFMTALGGIDITALLFCIDEVDQGLIALDASVQIEEEAWADKDIMEAIAGGIFIMAGIQTIETQALPVCEQVITSSAWSQFDKMTKVSMTSISKDVFLNESVITEKFDEAQAALKAQQYVKYGKAMGEALKEVTDEKHFLY